MKMKMLDLVENDWVGLRNGDICQVYGFDNGQFTLHDAVFNGYYQVLRWGDPFEVDPLGKYNGNGIPSQYDVENIITWKKAGFLWMAEKPVRHKLRYIDTV